MRKGSSPSNPRLMGLWLAQPETAAREVEEAILSTASVQAAARQLGVGVRTLQRWISTRPQLATYRATPEERTT